VVQVVVVLLLFQIQQAEQVHKETTAEQVVQVLAAAVAVKAALAVLVQVVLLLLAALAVQVNLHQLADHQLLTPVAAAVERYSQAVQHQMAVESVVLHQLDKTEQQIAVAVAAAAESMAALDKTAVTAVQEL
jgi:hypothetical protein